MNRTTVELARLRDCLDNLRTENGRLRYAASQAMHFLRALADHPEKGTADAALRLAEQLNAVLAPPPPAPPPAPGTCELHGIQLDEAGNCSECTRIYYQHHPQDR